MATRKYLRTNSDCCQLYRNKQFEKYGECESLSYEAFEQYVFKGKCGTYECPFYKQNKANIRTGKSERQPRRVR